MIKSPERVHSLVEKWPTVEKILGTFGPEEFSFLSPANGFLVRRVEVPPDSSRFFDENGGPRPGVVIVRHASPTHDHRRRTAGA